MQWRKILGAGGAAVAGAAAFNAFARRGTEPLANPLGGREGTFDWRGFDVAWSVRGENGPGGPPPLLLLHGIHAAASSYEWRHNVRALADGRAVYALDLLGFGRSARPPIRYTARTYMALISDFARRVVGTPCVLVANSLSGAYAIHLAARDAARFPALVLIEPTGLVRLNDAQGSAAEAAGVGIGTPVVGTAVFNALVARKSLRHFLEEVYADNHLVTEQLVDVYYDAAHQPGAKHAATAFVTGQLNLDVRDSLRRVTQPALLVWGEQAAQAPLEEVRGFLALKPDFELAILDPAGDLPHDERPAEFNEIVLTWLRKLDGARAVAAE
jgi:pimeloyl-ACP methyl ester carboxylesterase